MNYAVIDIGSNTVKCEIFKYEYTSIKSIDFITEQFYLISRLKNGIFSNEDIKALCSLINSYIYAAKKYNAVTYCFGTQSLRSIKNIDEVTKSIFKNTSLNPELISGNDEALLSFEGFLAEGTCIDNGTMIDMGGGSTEILWFEDKKVKNLNSFEFGCLSLKKEFVKNKFPSDREKTDIRNKVIKELSYYDWIKNSDTVCFIGGTGSAIATLTKALEISNSSLLSIEAFNSLFERLETPTEDIIELFNKYIPARAQTILPGITAYKAILESVNAKNIYISKGGIRNGYIYRKINGEL
ncbi:MAG: hypothetical protein IKU52_01830 [Clostridia bacterium]|nr:hypothetical protein [Clostridia bacterium]